MLKKSLLGLFALLLLVIFRNCSENSSNSFIESKVVVHLLNEPDMLNPYNWKVEESKYIIRNVYQKLLGFDFKTNELVPILAKSRPQIVKENNQLKITYEIKSGAIWDNKS